MNPTSYSRMYGTPSRIPQRMRDLMFLTSYKLGSRSHIHNNFKLKERLCVAFKLDCKDIFRFFAVQIYFKINFTCLIKPDLLV